MVRTAGVRCISVWGKKEGGGALKKMCVKHCMPNLMSVERRKESRRKGGRMDGLQT